MELPSGGDTSPGQPVHQLHPVALHPVPQAEGVVLGLAHRLGASGDDQAGGAGADLHGCVEHGLEAGATTAVDLQSRHRRAQSGVEGGYPPDGR